jgi:hypothetical protein
VNPNDTNLARVFTARVGAVISDSTFAVNQDFVVRVEAEAGSTIHGGGGPFETNLVIRDITANNDVPFAPAAGFSGNLATAAWPNLDQTFEYTVAAAGLAGRENHICQVYAFLRVGVVDANASFAASEFFMITPP